MNIISGKAGGFMEARYTAELIAHWFIWRNKVAEKDGADPITLMKLLKLMYYAESGSLAINNVSLFPDPIEAWTHGPVIPSIWRKYHESPYCLTVSQDDVEQLSVIQKDDRQVLLDVFETFGQYSAWGLRNLTHAEDPWREAVNGGMARSQPISRETMKKYFAENYI